MKTINEYIQMWQDAYNRKLEEVKTEYVAENGTFVSDPAVNQRIKEEAYYWFFSEDYEKSTDADTYVDTIVGMHLMENSSDAQAAYDDYMFGYEEEELSEIEHRIADTLKALSN